MTHKHLHPSGPDKPSQTATVDLNKGPHRPPGYAKRADEGQAGSRGRLGRKTEELGRGILRSKKSRSERETATFAGGFCLGIW